MLRRWSVAVPIAALCAWLAIAAQWTQGFRAFTSFSAARVAAGPLPRHAPPLEVVDEQFERWDIAAPSPHYRLVQAMYLRCPDACPIAMGSTGRLMRELADVIPSPLRVVSLSIDHDPPAALRAMWEAHGALTGWSMASLVNGPPEQTLARLGVWMFRRRDGLINHGLDLYLLDQQGEIVDVFAADEDVDSVARKIRRRLQ